MNRHWRVVVTTLVMSVPAVADAQVANLPDAIAVKGATILLQLHAEGAQIYQCKPDSSGQLTWQFREPIASLFREGATVGRHYAGPSWESSGSVVVGKPVARAPGAGPNDIPWLRLEVTDRHGDGPLQGVTTVQRINTRGGNTEGTCGKAGDLHTEPYAADYVFLRNAP